LNTYPASSLSPGCNHCLAGSNALPPHLVTADERLTELARILAIGLLRLRRRESEGRTSVLEKKGLDLQPERSVHALPKGRRRRRA
jgi:hypothetical protein